jgi:hypothetical protein
VGKTEEREQLEDVGVGGRVLLKLISRSGVGEHGLD